MASAHGHYSGTGSIGKQTEAVIAGAYMCECILDMAPEIAQLLHGHAVSLSQDRHLKR